MENNIKNEFLAFVTEPDNVHRAFEDPANFGLQAYNKLTTSQKQYLLCAAGIGLFIYGLVLGKKK
ncbi:hypothetical protein [Adhaeribacter aquaticus]|uniref:hypothetical protein n=1 Tax=Adhaeribacter aquaticus TaxID=299567 RepID=UPI00040CAECD|nr:hypothetical protein [Adhaeribacter aquaticus]